MKNNSLQLNPNVDYIKDIKNSKQDKLTAGEGITIDENNVIRSTGGSKLYRHNIMIEKKGKTWTDLGYYQILLTIITDSNKPFSITSLFDYIYSQVADMEIPASGYYNESVSLSVPIIAVTYNVSALKYFYRMRSNNKVYADVLQDTDNITDIVNTL